MVSSPMPRIAHRLGLALYATALLAGGPLIVVAGRLAASATPALRAALALTALVAIGALALGSAPATRALLAAAAVAAGIRTAAAFGFLGLARVPAALTEGTEMALVAAALFAELRARDPARRLTGAALGVVTLGALVLKAAWAMEATAVVRFGGLAMLPVALFALVGYGRSAAVSR